MRCKVTFPDAPAQEGEFLGLIPLPSGGWTGVVRFAGAGMHLTAADPSRITFLYGAAPEEPEVLALDEDTPGPRVCYVLYKKYGAAMVGTDKINAIKTLREDFALGLKAAKDLVETYMIGQRPSMGSGHDTIWLAPQTIDTALKLLSGGAK